MAAFRVVIKEFYKDALRGSSNRRIRYTEKPRFAETWLLNETVNSPRSTFPEIVFV